MSPTRRSFNQAGRILLPWVSGTCVAIGLAPVIGRTHCWTGCRGVMKGRAKAANGSGALVVTRRPANALSWLSGTASTCTVAAKSPVTLRRVPL